MKLSEEEKEFRPSKAMYRAKAILHRFCPPTKVVTLTPNCSELCNLIRPIPLAQIVKWLKIYGEDFWFWFITPPAVDHDELQAKEKAYETVMEILNLPSKNEAGETSIMNMKMKLEAAKLLLTQKGPMVAIQNNVDGEGGTPRGLRGKTNSQIEAQLNQLQRYTQRQELPGVIEAKMEKENE